MRTLLAACYLDVLCCYLLSPGLVTLACVAASSVVSAWWMAELATEDV